MAPKRCYYEVLELPRDCSPKDIKLAFRRLALTLHPDKQPPGSDVAAATAAFQELQHAHSVLSDPQERAYYDSHRSQILFTDPSVSGAASASPVPDLFAFFASSAFSGFSDSGRGFYKVYGDVFAKVYAQELAYSRRMGMPPDSVPPPPPLIGNLDSPYTQVTAFYNYWLGFATAMDFGWAAKWDAERGESRRDRRFMEEENKKAMRKARREYNDAVRGLAAFCKKRDKRVVEMALKKKAAEEKKKAEEIKRKKEEEKKKKERAMAYQEPEWARVEEDDTLFEDDEEEEMTAKRKEELYCVACNKKFKSDKQWKNHEQSKKHRDKVADLRMVFEEEEEALKEVEEEGAGGESDEADVGFDFKPAQESEESDWSDAAEELAEELDEGLEVQEEESDAEELDTEEPVVGSYDETSVLEAMLSSRKNKKSSFVAPQEEAPLSGAVDDDNDDDRSSEINFVKKNGRRRRAPKKGQDEGTYADNGQGEKSEIRPEESGHDNDADDKMEGPSSSNDDKSKADQQKGKDDNPKKNKKNKKGTEKKTTASVDQKTTSKGKKQKEVSKSKEPSNDCETCGQTFDTRNMLFSHLEESGHAKLKTRQKKR